MSVVVEASLESTRSDDTSDNAADWLDIQRRALLCLAAGSIWVLPHYWGQGATHAGGSVRACLMLVAGAAPTLLAVAIGAAPRIVRRAHNTGIGWGVGLASLPVALCAYQTLKLTHHRPLGAVVLSAMVLTITLVTTGGALFVMSKLGPNSGIRANSVPTAQSPLRPTFTTILGALLVAASFSPRLSLGNPRDLVVGVFLAGLVARLSVAGIPAVVARLAPLAYGVVVGAAVWFSQVDPSLIETLRSAPVLAGALGLLLQ